MGRCHDMLTGANTRRCRWLWLPLWSRRSGCCVRTAWNRRGETPTKRTTMTAVNARWARRTGTGTRTMMRRTWVRSCLRRWRRRSAMTAAVSATSSWRRWSRRRDGADASSCRGDALTLRTGDGASSKTMVLATVTAATVSRTVCGPATPRRTAVTPTGETTAQTISPETTVGWAGRRRLRFRYATTWLRRPGAPDAAS